MRAELRVTRAELRVMWAELWVTRAGRGRRARRLSSACFVMSSRRVPPRTVSPVAIRGGFGALWPPAAASSVSGVCLLRQSPVKSSHASFPLGALNVAADGRA